MSHVSNVILMASPSEDVVIPQIGLKRVEEHAGGTKAIENYVYAAGVNYLDTEDLIEWFKDHKWVSPAVLIIQTEGGKILVFKDEGME